MKETKTVQVYPDDAIVNAKIEEYESFGWEVVGNQRCQEYEGQTYGIDGSSTKHYSTFNKVTFTREKDSPWYSEVTQLEKEYHALKDTAETYQAVKPVLRKTKTEGFIAFGCGFILYMLFFVPGVIFTIVHFSAKAKYKKRYKKELAEYESEYPAKIRDLNNKCLELRARAERCVSGKV
ncbi:MAG: hypothetical protein K2K12_01145 [Clostridia bacterium]|nr:hypothetical protein [Clostridia bacterium]